VIPVVVPDKIVEPHTTMANRSHGSYQLGYEKNHPLAEKETLHLSPELFTRNHPYTIST
jgi:hypothetical protein